MLAYTFNLNTQEADWSTENYSIASLEKRKKKVQQNNALCKGLKKNCVCV